MHSRYCSAARVGSRLGSETAASGSQCMDTRLDGVCPPASSSGAANASHARQVRSPFLARPSSEGEATGVKSSAARPLGSPRLALRCCMLLRAAAEARACPQSNGVKRRGPRGQASRRAADRSGEGPDASGVAQGALDASEGAGGHN